MRSAGHWAMRRSHSPSACTCRPPQPSLQITLSNAASPLAPGPRSIRVELPVSHRSEQLLDLTSLPSTWPSPLRPHGAAARQLIDAFNRQALQDIAMVTGEALAPAGWSTAKLAVAALHRLFAREFGDEVDHQASTS
jgi:hypothetical protein